MGLSRVRICGFEVLCLGVNLKCFESVPFELMAPHSMTLSGGLRKSLRAFPACCHSPCCRCCAAAVAACPLWDWGFPSFLSAAAASGRSSARRAPARSSRACKWSEPHLKFALNLSSAFRILLMSVSGRAWEGEERRAFVSPLSSSGNTGARRGRRNSIALLQALVYSRCPGIARFQTGFAPYRIGCFAGR